MDLLSSLTFPPDFKPKKLTFAEAVASPQNYKGEELKRNHLSNESNAESKPSLHTSVKIIVSSQALLTNSHEVKSKPADSTTSIESQLDAGFVKCEFCKHDFKGSKGLKLHQNKCQKRQQSSQQLLVNPNNHVVVPS